MYLLIMFHTNEIATAQCFNYANTIGATSSSQTNASAVNQAWFANSFFNLNGTLFINQPTTFTNCNIDLGADAKIIIQAGKTLTITHHTHLRSCNGTADLWDYIEIQGTSSSNYGSLIVNDQSIIEDAEEAVYVALGSVFSLDIDDVFFNRNNKHIHLDLGNPIAAVSCSIQNSKFYCRSVYSQANTSGYVLHAPRQNQRTKMDIDLVKFTGTIGPDNIFDWANYGINTFNCNLTVENSTFRNLFSYGIWAGQNTSLTAHDNDFNKTIPRGIHCEHFVITLDAYRNTFTDVNYAFDLTDQVYTIHIYDNTITNSVKYAIYATNTYLNSPNGISDVDIYNNTISCPATVKGNGIYWSETIPPPNNWSFKIHDNPVMTGLKKGVELLNVWNPEITHNPQIEIINSTGGFGIKTTNCIEPVIYDNHIEGDEATACTNTTTGIINENCNDAIVNCNYVNNFNKGFNFKIQTIGNNFLKNTMARCKDQFYLTKNPQGLHNLGSANGASENVWIQNNIPDNCELFLNTNGNKSNKLSIGGFTNFYVLNSANSIPSLSNMSGNGSYVCTYQTTTLLPIDPCGAIGNTPVDAIIKLAYDSIAFDDETRGYEWLADQFLLDVLKKKQELATSDPVFQEALAQLEQTNHGIISGINYFLSVFMRDSANADAIRDSIRILDDNFNPSGTAEINFKLLNSIRFIALDAGGYAYLGQSEVDQLHEIAYQCPEEGGTAVYLARAILDIINGEAGDYESSCEDLPRFENIQEYDEFNFEIGYPIPASSFVTFNYLLPEQTEGTLVILNSLSEKVKLIKFTNRENSISLSLENFSSGIYFYKATSLYNSYSGKFAVIK
ncbi:MAG: T9SS type A sorting domain-containing protein [Bacteroidia bacterium]